MKAQHDRIHGVDYLALLVLAFASAIGINQYLYGLYNHFVTIPFIKSIIDSQLYPGDFLIAEKKYFYTYFLSGIAAIVKVAGCSIPQLFFLLYFLSLYTTLLVLFALSILLFKRKETAYFTLFFFIFSYTALGGVRTLESLFYERTLALPVLLAAICYYLKKKYILSYVLQGLTFLIHPLSAVYVIIMLAFSSLYYSKQIGWRNLAFYYGIILVCISPGLWLKHLNPAPSLNLLHADPQWLELLKGRSSEHIFPFSWPWERFLRSALFLAGFTITWKHRPSDFHHRVVLAGCAGVLFMCFIGTVFNEIFPVAIVIQFQFFRSLEFIFYLAVVYYANYFFVESGLRKNIIQNILAAAFFLDIFYDGNLPKYFSFLLMFVSVFPLYYLIRRWKASASNYYLAGQVVLLLIIGIAGCILRGSFSIYNAQDKEWLDIQYWAKKNTDKTDAFIVPPNKSGFRVESERTIYGDWKDGTQMYFNPAFGTEWIRRMKMLGYTEVGKMEEDYKSLPEGAFINIARELQNTNDTVYAVMPSDRPGLHFPVVYFNQKFKVYRVTDS